MSASLRLRRIPDPSKGHVHPTRVPHSYLGHRIDRRGHDLAPTPFRRFRRDLPGVMQQEPERIARTLAAWQGAMSF